MAWFEFAFFGALFGFALWTAIPQILRMWRQKGRDDVLDILQAKGYHEAVIDVTHEFLTEGR